MPREIVSTGGKWSDVEKLQVFFSIIESFEAPIDWNKVTLPEGRSIKAVKGMIDTTKKQSRAGTNANEEGNATPATPKKPESGAASTPKTKTPRGRKPKLGNEEGTPAHKRKRAASKQARMLTEAEDADDSTDLEDLILNPSTSKKVKTEEEKTGDMTSDHEVEAAPAIKQE